MKSRRQLYLWLLIGVGPIAVVWIIGVLAVSKEFAFELLIVLMVSIASALLVVRFAPRIVGISFRETPEPLRGFVLLLGFAAGATAAMLLTTVLLENQPYDVRDAMYGIVATSFFLSLIFPLRGLFVSRKTVTGKRVVYYLFSFVMTILVGMVCMTTVGDYADHRFYDTVTSIRGIRTVSNPSVAVLELGAWPGEKEGVDLLIALQRTDVAAIVLPTTAFDTWQGESYSRIKQILPFDKLVFNLYGRQGKWNSVSQGISTIEVGFPAGHFSLTRSKGAPMFYQPSDTWGKDLALAALQESNLLADIKEFTPEHLAMPISEKKRTLINHYLVKTPSGRYPVPVDERSPFPALHYFRSTNNERSTIFFGYAGFPEGRCWVNPDKKRLETYATMKKQEGTYQLDVYDTTKPSAFTPKSLAGKILFLNVPSNDNGFIYEPLKCEAFQYATITQNILSHDYLTEPKQLHQFLAGLLLMGIVMLMYIVLSPWKACGSSLVLLPLTAYVLYYLFAHASLFVGISWFASGFVGITAFLFPYELVVDRSKLLEERTRLRTELEAAREMQMGLMPTSDPAVAGFDISGVCKPAEEVGGDYFDYVWLNEEKTRLGIAIADVSGKAMKAAMTAVMTSGMVYRELGSNETPKTILRKINRPMYFKTDKRIFTAMSFAVIDTVRKSLAFSNAGQMQPLLKRNGMIESLKVEGARLPLGMAEDVEYNELTIALQSGDTLVFYTDGIPEAMNAKNEMFGFERLEATVKETTSNLSAKQVAAKIVEKVAEFAGSAKKHDDMTVVVVRVL